MPLRSAISGVDPFPFCVSEHLHNDRVCAVVAGAAALVTFVQVMASGMTDSTARYENSPCNGTYREDLMGLRPLGSCAFTSYANFGVVEVRLVVFTASGCSRESLRGSPVCRQVKPVKQRLVHLFGIAC